MNDFSYLHILGVHITLAELKSLSFSDREKLIKYSEEYYKQYKPNLF